MEPRTTLLFIKKRSRAVDFFGASLATFCLSQWQPFNCVDIQNLIATIKTVYECLVNVFSTIGSLERTLTIKQHLLAKLGLSHVEKSI